VLTEQVSALPLTLLSPRVLTIHLLVEQIHQSLPRFPSLIGKLVLMVTDSNQRGRANLNETRRCSEPECQIVIFGI
jgi:hypothetical protein